MTFALIGISIPIQYQEDFKYYLNCYFKNMNLYDIGVWSCFGFNKPLLGASAAKKKTLRFLAHFGVTIVGWFMDISSGYHTMTDITNQKMGFRE